jgi:hypothetical protein
VIAETPAPHREVFHSLGRIADGVRDDAFEHIAFRCVLPCGCHPAGFKDDGVVARAVTGIGSTSRSLAHTPCPHSAATSPLASTFALSRDEWRTIILPRSITSLARRSNRAADCSPSGAMEG